MSKKILYIKAQGLGDMIGGIPFLVKQKALGNKVYQTFYDMHYINRGVSKLPKDVQERYKKYPMYQGRYNMLQIFKDSKLIEDIIFIPSGLIPLIKFFFKNIKRFDIAIIPIKTRAAQVLAKILSRKSYCFFQGVNDISRYKILADGEHEGPCPALYTYSDYVSLPSESIELPSKYITIFPSIFERSLEMPEWISIMKYVVSKGYTVIILGGDREQWFVEELKKHNAYDIVTDYLTKTSFAQMIYVLRNASLTISGNGGPMWLANLVNPHCLNIHTVSAFLMEPPVDKVNSFNIRPYEYPCCRPCESANTDGSKTIPQCVFYKTAREGECRTVITSALLISHIKKILS